ncbi:MAG TPA: L-threonylcarbamoyladenylate synthase [Candidatus Limnocylindrales bacterium]|nr:L-threonylcarbamoyladenylate synthase [Candidatus Limnocylindrales bacterium]
MRYTEFRTTNTILLPDDQSSIVRAAQVIRQGGLVAFPTETVYGLGAAATDAKAVTRIYVAKGRPADNPLIVHIAEVKQLEEVSTAVPDSAHRLAQQFWPGPLSLILPRSNRIPALVSAGLGTVAVRMPDHKVALALILASGVPIAAPSANRSGRPSPTTYKHVLADLAGRIDIVIKCCPCPIGVESTVLDLTSRQPTILRPGGITRAQLESALGCKVALAGRHSFQGVPLSPGMKYRHYSPRAPLILVTGSCARRRILVQSLFDYYSSRGLKVGLLNSVLQGCLHDSDIAQRLAASLYKTLREMDCWGADIILAEKIDEKGLGLAVMNRLGRAAVRVLKA